MKTKGTTATGIKRDFFNTRTAGVRVVIRGGNLNNTTNAGAGNVNVNNDLTNANANIGGRVAEWMKKKKRKERNPATLKR